MASTGKPRGLEKRKACDLCHIKKIRCDAEKPTCSHCRLYKGQCTYTPHIQRRRKELEREENIKSSTGVERRLDQLEEKLQRLAPSVPQHRESATTRVNTYGIPPLVELLPIVEDYFANFNSIVPLFDRKSFMSVLSQWYTFNDVPAWTAINVVLALSWRHGATSRLLGNDLDGQKCIENAMSAMNGLVTRDQDLLGLQVLLGLAMLFQGTPHPRQASAIMATAVQLTHRLRLHQKQRGSVSTGAESVLVRDRVFWITYVLDKDISARTQEPYLQQDNDMSVDMPTSSTGNGLVEFTTKDGRKEFFDLFRTQVQLARIQGDIYDSMYSVRAESLPASEQQFNAQRLSQALGAWIGAIPVELQPETIANTDVSPKAAVRHFVMLYFTCLRSLHKVSRVSSHDAEWIKRLVDYSQRYIGAFPIAAASLSLQSPIPSKNWSTIVGSARACMKLFQLANRSDTALIWNITCTYVSAALVLVTNKLTLPEHGLGENADNDSQLIGEAVVFLDWAAKELGEESIRKMHSAYSELSCRARVAERKFLVAQQEISELEKLPALAWLEGEAVKSVSYSTMSLIEAFTQAPVKPLPKPMYTR